VSDRGSGQTAEGILCGVGFVLPKMDWGHPSPLRLAAPVDVVETRDVGRRTLKIHLCRKTPL